MVTRLLRDFGALLLGIGLGGFIAVLPALLVGAFVVGGAAMFLVAIARDAAEQRKYRSRAVELVFEGPDTPCVKEHIRSRDISSTPNNPEDPNTTYTLTRQLYLESVTVRLAVKNVRADKLRDVTVKLRSLTLPGEAKPVYPALPLRWMNDPQPSYPMAHSGISIGPGIESYAYVEVANKRTDMAYVSIQFASDAAAAQYMFGKEFDLLFEVDARDDKSSIPAPTHKQSFRLSVLDNGTLSLSPARD
jgi:hypothetical protein